MLSPNRRRAVPLPGAQAPNIKEVVFEIYDKANFAMQTKTFVRGALAMGYGKTALLDRANVPHDKTTPENCKLSRRVPTLSLRPKTACTNTATTELPS